METINIVGGDFAPGDWVASVSQGSLWITKGETVSMKVVRVELLTQEMNKYRRFGQLAWILRAATLVDVDCWTRVLGEPLKPGAILEAIRQKMPKGGAQ